MNLNQQPRVYPAVYSGVGVYECMIRGIAVMRRRADSYVNATQILKVAGIDKGRRTKILEKEILPGKHEIVQGGYGKYQGTWIPLDRGRDVAAQYGVSALLGPLFDHVPNPAMMGAMPHLGGPLRGPGSIPPMHFPTHMRPPPPYMIHYMPPNMVGRPPMFPPGAHMYPPYQQIPSGTNGQPRMPHLYPPMPHPFIPPGSAPVGLTSPGPRSSSAQAASSSSSLKRTREDTDNEAVPSQDTDVTMVGGEGGSSSASQNGVDAPPSKKPRKEGDRINGFGMDLDSLNPAANPVTTIDPKALSKSYPPINPLPESFAPAEAELLPRPSTSSPINRIQTRAAVQRSTKRAQLYTAIREDDAEAVIGLLLESTDDPMLSAADLDAVVDDKGHTSLHVATALGKISVVEALVLRGADVHRGNNRGETALMRAVLTNHHYQAQNFESLLKLLRQSLRTTDDLKKTVLHHLAFVSGALLRVPEANYYLETILMWVGKHEGGLFSTIVDLTDENGDTSLNIAARLGAKPFIKTLLAFGARSNIPNRFGLRPSDYGLLGENIEDDLVESTHPDPNFEPTPFRSSEQVLKDMSKLISSMTEDLAAEKAAKRMDYETVQDKLKSTTRLLAEKRRELEKLRSDSQEVDGVAQRISKLTLLRDTPGSFDWRGRSATDDVASTPLSFRTRSVPPIESLQLSSMEKDVDRALASTNDPKSLVLLRRVKMWHERMNSVLRLQQTPAKEVGLEKELQYKKVIALCTGIPADKIDENLEALLESFASEPQDPGQSRLADFMDKTKIAVA